MAATVAQLGNVKAKNRAATQIVLDAAKRAGYTVQQVWGAGGGDHAGGLATDFMVYSNRAMGDWVSSYVWNNRARLGVRWIIWRQRIISINPNSAYGPPGVWNWMENRGNATQNHMDHVHVMWSSAAVKGGGTPTPAMPWLIASQPGVYLDYLRPGVKNSTSVYRYQVRARAYLGSSANKHNPSGATGTFGAETTLMTQRIYVDLAKKAGGTGGGWATRNSKGEFVSTATWPGEGLIRRLGIPIHGKASPPDKKPATEPSPPAPKPLPPVQEDEMPFTPEQLKEYAGVGVHGQQVGRATLENGKPRTIGITLDRTYNAAIATAAQVTALSAAVSALADARNVDPEVVLRSVSDEVHGAMVSLAAYVTEDDPVGSGFGVEPVFEDASPGVAVSPVVEGDGSGA